MKSRQHIAHTKSKTDERKKSAISLHPVNPPAPIFPVDPTAGDIWDMRYIFEKDGEELDAIPGDQTPFYTVKEGVHVGMKQLLAEGWMLLNEVGIEINYEQAVKISQILKQQKKKEA